MKSYDAEGFGARIREEMERAGIEDIRTLQQKVHRAAKGERGTSYSAVFQYTKGTWPTEPRRGVVEALARVLNGVRPEYLLFNGERTPADQLARERGEAADAGHSREAWAADIDRLFDEAFPGAGRYEERDGVTWRLRGPGAAAHAQLWRLWAAVRGVRARVAQAAGELDSFDEAAESVAAAEQVVSAVLAPLHAMNALPPQPSGGDMPGVMGTVGSPLALHAHMWGDRLDSFIVSTCETLLSIARRQDNRIADGIYRVEESDGEA